MSIASRVVPGSGVVYPDTDGHPMAENTVQYRYLTMIKGGLEVVFRERPDVFVAGDLFWYPVEGRPDIRTAPDVLVALGRPRGDRSSYMQWLEDGTAPHVVFEILSPSNTVADMVEKSLFYERYGVIEYYVYDPDRGEFSGWTREGAEARPIPRTGEWVSPVLGIRFQLLGKELQLFGPDGCPFATYEALAEERRRAEAERDRAQEEARRERERAERFAARLRELGVDPEQ